MDDITRPRQWHNKNESDPFLSFYYLLLLGACLVCVILVIFTTGVYVLNPILLLLTIISFKGRHWPSSS